MKTKRKKSLYKIVELLDQSRRPYKVVYAICMRNEAGTLSKIIDKGKPMVFDELEGAAAKIDEFEKEDSIANDQVIPSQKTP